MAVPAYTTDLQDFEDFEGTAPTLSEFTGYTAGRSQAVSLDYPIQGTKHADTVMNTTGHASCSVDYGSNIAGWVSGWAFFPWLVWTAPGAIQTQASGGLVFIVGSSLSAYDGWFVGGKDFGSYPYGGWQCFAVDPEIGYSEQVGGGPGTSYRYVGCGVDVATQVSKGSPLGVDAIRYGRGELRVAGGSVGDGYATFAGMAAANDGSTARWGLFQAIPGGYQWKGLMYFGYGALTEFTDSNVNIVIDNTEFVTSSFNRIEINNTSSKINWTNINITALGTVSRGQFEMIDNATEFNDTGGVFTDMDTFIYLSNAVITGKTFRRCGEVTQGGATFSGCVFDSPGENVIDSSGEEFSALVCSDLDEVSDCEFNSYGFGHAIELTSAHADSSGASPYTLDGCTFTGYASSDGSTGDEAIYNNSGGHVIINVVNGSVPSVRNGSGASTSITSSVPVVITVIDQDNQEVPDARVAVYKLSDNSELINDDADSDGILSTSVPYTAPIDVYIRVRQSLVSDDPRYIPFSTTGQIDGNGLTLTVTLTEDTVAA